MTARRGRVGVCVVLTAFLVAFAALSPLSPGLAAAQAPTSCAAASGSTQVGGSPGALFGGLSDADLARELDLARDAGMFAVRIDVDWSVVEPVRGNRDWSVPDRMVDAITARGMCVLGIVTYAPEWARVATAVEEEYGRPADPRRFAEFAGAAAERYRDRISLWEVWNEPNLSTYFKPAPDPVVYALMLRGAHRAITRANPDAVVVSGGMAPGSAAGGGIPAVAFVLALYELGAVRYADALNVHPFTFPGLPSDAPAVGDAGGNSAMVLWPIRDVMVARGDAAKPVWMTAVGAPTGSAEGAVSEDAQATTVRILLNATVGNSWLGPSFVYAIRDNGTDESVLDDNFGIVRRDYTPKPALAEVRDFTRRYPPNAGR
ncbi:glycoside hydrolase 5 family protein [Rhodococcoides kroppenstedtii]|uniref:beta-xylosidase n=1 Tax=Rhodococcoides kroppenstedtii TaxID=293050 RepID=UPI003644010C